MDEEPLSTTFKWSFPTSPHFIKEIIIGIILVICLGIPIHVATEYPYITSGSDLLEEENDDSNNDADGQQRSRRSRSSRVSFTSAAYSRQDVREMDPQQTLVLRSPSQNHSQHLRPEDRPGDEGTRVTRKESNGAEGGSGGGGGGGGHGRSMLEVYPSVDQRLQRRWEEACEMARIETEIRRQEMDAPYRTYRGHSEDRTRVAQQSIFGGADTSKGARTRSVPSSPSMRRRAARGMWDNSRPSPWSIKETCAEPSVSPWSRRPGVSIGAHAAAAAAALRAHGSSRTRSSLLQRNEDSASGASQDEDDIPFQRMTNQSAFAVPGSIQTPQPSSQTSTEMPELRVNQHPITPTLQEPAKCSDGYIAERRVTVRNTTLRVAMAGPPQQKLNSSAPIDAAVYEQRDNTYVTEQVIRNTLLLEAVTPPKQSLPVPSEMSVYHDCDDTDNSRRNISDTDSLIGLQSTNKSEEVIAVTPLDSSDDPVTHLNRKSSNLINTFPSESCISFRNVKIQTSVSQGLFECDSDSDNSVSKSNDASRMTSKSSLITVSSVASQIRDSILRHSKAAPDSEYKSCLDLSDSSSSRHEKTLLPQSISGTHKQERLYGSKAISRRSSTQISDEMVTVKRREYSLSNHDDEDSITDLPSICETSISTHDSLNHCPRNTCHEGAYFSSKADHLSKSIKRSVHNSLTQDMDKSQHSLVSTNRLVKRASTIREQSSQEIELCSHQRQSSSAIDMEPSTAVTTSESYSEYFTASPTTSDAASSCFIECSEKPSSRLYLSPPCARVIPAAGATASFTKIFPSTPLPRSSPQATVPTDTLSPSTLLKSAPPPVMKPYREDVNQSPSAATLSHALTPSRATVPLPAPSPSICPIHRCRVPSETSSKYPAPFEYPTTSSIHGKSSKYRTAVPTKKPSSPSKSGLSVSSSSSPSRRPSREVVASALMRLRLPSLARRPLARAMRHALRTNAIPHRARSSSVNWEDAGAGVESIERKSQQLFKRSRQMVWRLTNQTRAIRDRLRRTYGWDFGTDDEAVQTQEETASDRNELPTRSKRITHENDDLSRRHQRRKTYDCPSRIRTEEESSIKLHGRSTSSKRPSNLIYSTNERTNRSSNNRIPVTKAVKRDGNIIKPCIKPETSKSESRYGHSSYPTMTHHGSTKRIIDANTENSKVHRITRHQRHSYNKYVSDVREESPKRESFVSVKSQRAEQVSIHRRKETDKSSSRIEMKAGDESNYSIAVESSPSMYLNQRSEMNINPQTSDSFEDWQTALESILQPQDAAFQMMEKEEWVMRCETSTKTRNTWAATLLKRSAQLQRQSASISNDDKTRQIPEVQLKRHEIPPKHIPSSKVEPPIKSSRVPDKSHQREATTGKAKEQKCLRRSSTIVCHETDSSDDWHDASERRNSNVYSPSRPKNSSSPTNTTFTRQKDWECDDADTDDDMTLSFVLPKYDTDSSDSEGNNKFDAIFKILLKSSATYTKLYDCDKKYKERKKSQTFQKTAPNNVVQLPESPKHGKNESFYKTKKFSRLKVNKMERESGHEDNCNTMELVSSIPSSLIANDSPVHSANIDFRDEIKVIMPIPKYYETDSEMKDTSSSAVNKGNVSEPGNTTEAEGPEERQRTHIHMGVKACCEKVPRPLIMVGAWPQQAPNAMCVSTRETSGSSAHHVKDLERHANVRSSRRPLERSAADTSSTTSPCSSPPAVLTSKPSSSLHKKSASMTPAPSSSNLLSPKRVSSIFAPSIAAYSTPESSLVNSTEASSKSDLSKSSPISSKNKSSKTTFINPSKSKNAPTPPSSWKDTLPHSELSLFGRSHSTLSSPPLTETTTSSKPRDTESRDSLKTQPKAESRRKCPRSALVCPEFDQRSDASTYDSSLYISSVSPSKNSPCSQPLSAKPSKMVCKSRRMDFLEELNKHPSQDESTVNQSKSDSAKRSAITISPEASTSKFEPDSRPKRHESIRPSSKPSLKVLSLASAKPRKSSSQMLLMIPKPRRRVSTTSVKSSITCKNKVVQRVITSAINRLREIIRSESIKGKLKVEATAAIAIALSAARLSAKRAVCPKSRRKRRRPVTERKRMKKLRLPNAISSVPSASEREHTESNLDVKSERKKAKLLSLYMRSSSMCSSSHISTMEGNTLQSGECNLLHETQQCTPEINEGKNISSTFKTDEQSVIDAQCDKSITHKNPSNDLPEKQVKVEKHFDSIKRTTAKCNDTPVNENDSNVGNKKGKKKLIPQNIDSDSDEQNKGISQKSITSGSCVRKSRGTIAFVQNSEESTKKSQQTSASKEKKNQRRIESQTNTQPTDKQLLSNNLQTVSKENEPVSTKSSPSNPKNKSSVIILHRRKTDRDNNMLMNDSDISTGISNSESYDTNSDMILSYSGPQPLEVLQEEIEKYESDGVEENKIIDTKYRPLSLQASYDTEYNSKTCTRDISLNTMHEDIETKPVYSTNLTYNIKDMNLQSEVQSSMSSFLASLQTNTHESVLSQSINDTAKEKTSTSQYKTNTSSRKTTPKTQSSYCQEQLSKSIKSQSRNSKTREKDSKSQQLKHKSVRYSPSNSQSTRSAKQKNESLESNTSNKQSCVSHPLINELSLSQKTKTISSQTHTSNSVNTKSKSKVIKSTKSKSTQWETPKETLGIHCQTSQSTISQSIMTHTTMSDVSKNKENNSPISKSQSTRSKSTQWETPLGTSSGLYFQISQTTISQSMIIPSISQYSKFKDTGSNLTEDRSKQSNWTSLQSMETSLSNSHSHGNDSLISLSLSVSSNINSKSIEKNSRRRFSSHSQPVKKAAESHSRCASTTDRSMRSQSIICTNNDQVNESTLIRSQLFESLSSLNNSWNINSSGSQSIESSTLEVNSKENLSQNIDFTKHQSKSLRREPRESIFLECKSEERHSFQDLGSSDSASYSIKEEKHKPKPPKTTKKAIHIPRSPTPRNWTSLKNPRSNGKQFSDGNIKSTCEGKQNEISIPNRRPDFSVKDETYSFESQSPVQQSSRQSVVTHSRTRVSTVQLPSSRNSPIRLYPLMKNAIHGSPVRQSASQQFSIEQTPSRISPPRTAHKQQLKQHMSVHQPWRKSPSYLSNQPLPSGDSLLQEVSPARSSPTELSPLRQVLVRQSLGKQPYEGLSLENTSSKLSNDKQIEETRSLEKQAHKRLSSEKHPYEILPCEKNSNEITLLKNAPIYEPPVSQSPTQLSPTQLSISQHSSRRPSSPNLSLGRQSPSRLSSMPLSPSPLLYSPLSSSQSPSSQTSTRNSSGCQSLTQQSTIPLPSLKILSIRISPERKSPTRLSPEQQSPERLLPTRQLSAGQPPSSVRLSPAQPSSGRMSPPRQSPPRQSPPRQSPPRQSPPRQSPPRQSPPRQSPTRMSLVQSLTGQSPARQPSARQSPPQQSLTPQPPVYQTRAEDSPVNLSSTTQSQTKQTPAQEPPAQKYSESTERASLIRLSSVRQTPVCQSPVRQSPVRQSPVRQSPVRQSPVRQSPIRQSPVRQSPAHQSPVRQSPVRQSPVRQSPVRQSPVRQSPVHQSPVRQSPVHLSPVRQSPVRQSPVRQSLVHQSLIPQSPVRPSAVHQSPARQSPIGQSPVLQSPVQQSPVRQSGEQQLPVRQSPIKQSPVRQTQDSKPPVRHSPVRQSLVQQSPVRLSPVRQSPVRQSPVRQSPVRQSPVRQSPVRQSPVRQSPVRQSPVRQSPIRESPIRLSPVRQSPVRQSPIRQSPVRQSPIRQSPALQQTDQRSLARQSPTRRPQALQAPARKSLSLLSLERAVSIVESPVQSPTQEPQFLPPARKSHQQTPVRQPQPQERHLPELQWPTPHLVDRQSSGIQSKEHILIESQRKEHMIPESQEKEEKVESLMDGEPRSILLLKTLKPKSQSDEEYLLGKQFPTKSSLINNALEPKVSDIQLKLDWVSNELPSDTCLSERQNVDTEDSSSALQKVSKRSCKSSQSLFKELHVESTDSQSLYGWRTENQSKDRAPSPNKLSQEQLLSKQTANNDSSLDRPCSQKLSPNVSLSRASLSGGKLSGRRKDCNRCIHYESNEHTSQSSVCPSASTNTSITTTEVPLPTVHSPVPLGEDKHLLETILEGQTNEPQLEEEKSSHFQNEGVWIRKHKNDSGPMALVPREVESPSSMERYDGEKWLKTRLALLPPTPPPLARRLRYRTRSMSPSTTVMRQGIRRNSTTGCQEAFQECCVVTAQRVDFLRLTCRWSPKPLSPQAEGSSQQGCSSNALPSAPRIDGAPLSSMRFTAIRSRSAPYAAPR